MDPAQAQPPIVSPVVPISEQPLTLDPNLMVTQPPVAQPAQIQYSGPHKEAAPLMQAPVAEYVKPTEISPQLAPELAEAGVEVVINREQPQLTPEHTAVGIEAAKESVPVVVSSAPTTIQLPYSAAQVKQIEKEAPISESRHWLANLTEYLLRKFQLIPAK